MTRKHLQYICLLNELFTENSKFIRDSQINRRGLVEHFFFSYSKKNMIKEFLNGFWNQMGLGLSSGYQSMQPIGYQLNPLQTQQLAKVINTGQLVNVSMTANNSGSFTTELRFVSY